MAVCTYNGVVGEGVIGAVEDICARGEVAGDCIIGEGVVGRIAKINPISRSKRNIAVLNRDTLCSIQGYSIRICPSNIFDVYSINCYIKGSQSYFYSVPIISCYVFECDVFYQYIIIWSIQKNICIVPYRIIYYNIVRSSPN